ncbi:MAG: sigma-54 dependent transcriptional regulator [Planctomycetota bacterium]
MSEPTRVLVVDDESYVRNSLVDLLEADDIEASAAASGEEAFERLSEQVDVHVVVTDLSMPGMKGSELVAKLHALAPELPVIVLTGVGTVRDAVGCMKSGAFDYLTKPVDPDEFLVLIRKAAEHRNLVGEVRRLRHEVDQLKEPSVIVGESESIREILRLIEDVAPTDATVLVLGESGTGKELVAQEIHRLSGRADQPFVRVNCGAIAEGLFESEFFGHRRGSFTGATEDRTGRFAEAHHGTLALDEIGTLKLDAQAKLLRVLESGEYSVVGESKTRHADVRVIAITNEDLASRVQEGQFREDLFYRLNVLPIEVPPLAARKDDLPRLVEHFLELFSTRGRSRLESVEAEALEALRQYDWPGNIRELKNVLERATILERTTSLTATTVRRILNQGTALPKPESHGDNLNIRQRVEHLERSLIEEALRRSDGKKKEAAQLLGIDYRNFAYYAKKHGLS